MCHLAGIDGPLKLVDRLTPIEQGAQLAAKLRIAEEVAQEQRAQQFAQVIRSFVDGVALGGAAEALQRDNRTHASRID